MSNLNGFRNPQRVKDLVSRINTLSKSIARRIGRSVQIMEVCGGHTHAIFHSGINQLLSNNVEFVHGPGCPVCVLPKEAIDTAIDLAQESNTILATFGDVLRVPGSSHSLLQARALGADVRILYSPFDAISLAQSNLSKNVIFLAIGFDTTMPAIAFTIKGAKKRQVRNLKFLCYHIRLLPTLRALLESNSVTIDGFIGPGHVSIVLGRAAFDHIALKYHKPMVVAGFEPVDFLQALLMLLQQLDENRCEVENAYTRVVSEQGNQTALKAMQEVFANGRFTWRGVGELSDSVTTLSPAFRQFDARLNVLAKTPAKWHEPTKEPEYCQQVLMGQLKPDKCPLFNRQCTPENPKGPLMVSSEGACAAYQRYRSRQSNMPLQAGNDNDND